MWWHCWTCRSNIRSFIDPKLCPLCGGWDISEWRLTAPATGQGSMFERGAVDGDLVHPDDEEGQLREIVAGLLRLRASLAAAAAPSRQRMIPAREHWLPFTTFIHHGQVVGRHRSE